MLSELGVKDGQFENVKSKVVLDNIRGALAEYKKHEFPPSATDHIVTFLTKGFNVLISIFGFIFF